MAAASEVVVMVRGLGDGVGVGVGVGTGVGVGSAALRSADEVQPTRTIRPERRTRTEKRAVLRNEGMKVSPNLEAEAMCGYPVFPSAG